MRQIFEEQLLDLKKRISNMGDNVQEAIAIAMQSLEERDLEKAKVVIEGDRKINEEVIEIEELCVRLIATQQPFARDLRKIVAGYKIIMSLERMGDLAADIAKASIRIGSVPLMKPLVDLPQMAEYGRQMIQLGIDAYIQENEDIARRMSQLDDKVDYLYKQIFKDLFDLMKKDKELIEQGIKLLFAGRYLERIGDYCTNISEEVLYMVSGIREDLNRN